LRYGEFADEEQGDYQKYFFHIHSL
jgi:hypothetical protein